ncbi:MAG: PEP-CTERM sorting domain-containing protein [Spirulina sp. SIO3F2]|nr:PEP-CTERM sorting domain-containing protein [Spirulina sp. SIO3F2]
MGWSLAEPTLAANELAFNNTTHSPTKRIRISQESQPHLGDFDANVLGFIDAIQTKQTAAEYYGYNQQNDASFSGAFNLLSNTSHLFLVDAADGLSLFVVHDRPQDSGWGRASMQVDLLGDDADLLVMDDSPQYDRYIAQDSTFLIQHGWGTCCTDGFALGALENDWQTLLQFTQAPIGLQSWQAFADSNTTPIDLELAVHQRVRLDWVEDAETIPEPSTLIGLMVLGIVGLLTRKH